MSEKYKILYVDDELINLQLFKINFSNKYEVSTANSGLKGLEMLEKETDITAVISDMKMPLMTGIEFIKQAKKKYPDIKFFILTGFEITNEIQEAISSNLILKYFMKPFNMKEIETVLDESLS